MPQSDEVLAVLGEASPLGGLCPKCGAPFEQFMPSQVARDMFSPWRWLLATIGRGRPELAIICRACKEIVGYEGASKNGWVYEWLK